MNSFVYLYINNSYNFYYLYVGGGDKEKLITNMYLRIRVKSKSRVRMVWHENIRDKVQVNVAMSFTNIEKHRICRGL